MNTITELSRTINMLMAHPDNEPNSEFADRIDSLIDLKEQLTLTDVVKSLPTEQCVRDWWREGTGDEHFWKHETDWSNEQVFREIYQALTYFINKWQ
jgi:hypothetical protein